MNLFKFFSFLPFLGAVIKQITDNEAALVAGQPIVIPSVRTYINGIHVEVGITVKAI